MLNTEMSNTQMNKSYSQRAYIQVEVGGRWEWERKGKIVGGYSKEMLETRERKDIMNSSVFDWNWCYQYELMIVI